MHKNAMLFSAVINHFFFDFDLCSVLFAPEEFIPGLKYNEN